VKGVTGTHVYRSINRRDVADRSHDFIAYLNLLRRQRPEGFETVRDIQRVNTPVTNGIENVAN
jgi:hypothetical protein